MTRSKMKAKPVSFSFASWHTIITAPMLRVGLALGLAAGCLSGCVVYPVDAGPAYYAPAPAYYYGPHYYYGPGYYHPWHGCYRCY